MMTVEEIQQALLSEGETNKRESNCDMTTSFGLACRREVGTHQSAVASGFQGWKLGFFLYACFSFFFIPSPKSCTDPPNAVESNSFPWRMNFVLPLFDKPCAQSLFFTHSSQKAVPTHKTLWSRISFYGGLILSCAVQFCKAGGPEKACLMSGIAKRDR